MESSDVGRRCAAKEITLLDITIGPDVETELILKYPLGQIESNDTVSVRLAVQALEVDRQTARSRPAARFPVSLAMTTISITGGCASLFAGFRHERLPFAARPRGRLTFELVRAEPSTTPTASTAKPRTQSCSADTAILPIAHVDPREASR